MTLGQHFRDAVRNLLSTKLRSLLAVLGVFVGTASVVALVSSGEEATLHALAQFKQLGTNLLSISIAPQQQGGGPQAQAGPTPSKISVEKIQQIAARVPEIQETAPYTLDYSQVNYQGKQLQAAVVGVTEAFADVVKLDMAQGRFISFLDRFELYAVIGSKVAESLKSLGVLNPIGKQIQVGSTIFTIIGVYKPWPTNMFIYVDLNNALIIPIQTSLTLSKYVNINNVIFRLHQNPNVDQVKQDVTNAVNLIAPGNRLFFTSPEQLINSMKRQHQTFTVLLGLIGAISLLVGGIGVMNIMLVSVTERKREIGIRMAIGAKRRDIQTMFLMESVTLTIFGGILGVIAGIIISLVITEFAHWGFHLFVLPPEIGFIVSVLVGVFFGYYPAVKASKLDPIETLRE